MELSTAVCRVGQADGPAVAVEAPAWDVLGRKDSETCGCRSMCARSHLHSARPRFWLFQSLCPQHRQFYTVSSRKRSPCPLPQKETPTITSPFLSPQ